MRASPLLPGASANGSNARAAETKFPVNTADLATHVLWQHEDRADISDAIPQLVANIEQACAQPYSISRISSGDRDLEVRSIFALSSIAHNARLRDKINARPGFLSLVADHAVDANEPSLAGAYMGLLYRLTFRLAGFMLIPSSNLERLLDWLVAYATSAAATAEPPNVQSAGGGLTTASMCLGVLANLSRSCLPARAYVKSQQTAPELYKALTQLLASPGHYIIIFFALQALANLVLHDSIGAVLFGRDNLRLIFEIVFSLLREADQSEHVLHALRAASDLLSDLFVSPRVLELMGNSFFDAIGDLEDLLAAIAILRHSPDPALPLLELACALTRAPSLRRKLLSALHSPKAERVGVLTALLGFAACAHIDVAVASTSLLGTLCREGLDAFGKGLDSSARAHAITELAEVVGIRGASLSDRTPKTRRRAVCRVLHELSQSTSFSEDIRAQVREAHMVREARAALHEQDGTLVLLLLLLAFQCWESVSLAERRELLLFARSQPVVDTWSDIMASSSDSAALHECILAACHLFAVSRVEDKTHTPGNVSSSKLPVWIELQMLVEALAAANGGRDNELDNMRLKIGRLDGELVREKDKCAKAEGASATQMRQDAEALEDERRRHAQELRAYVAELEGARKRCDEAVGSAARDSRSLAQACSKLEAAERRIEDAEITHADLLQRALKAENLCRQLGGKLQEKDTELRRINQDREDLLHEVERRQRFESELAAAKDIQVRLETEITEISQKRAALQRENQVLVDTRERLETELQHARTDIKEHAIEAQRRASLLDARAEDLNRRLSSSDAALRAAENERDKALREASWLRCELAALQRHEQDREKRHLHSDPFGRQALTDVEQRLRERAKQAHSDAMEFRVQ
jgi:hypothetical protein